METTLQKRCGAFNASKHPTPSPRSLNLALELCSMLMVSPPPRMRDTDLQDKGSGGNLKYANSSEPIPRSQL